VRPAPALAALAAVLAHAAPARGDDAFQAQASLHLRTTTTQNLPSTLVLYDRQARTFDVGSYLVPEGDERYGSLIASLRFSGALLGGDLRWVFLADTGEVRNKGFPNVAMVCPALGGTGLDVVGSGRCVGPGAALETTRLADPIVISNGRPIGDELSHTLFIREAYLAWSFGKAGFATLRAGRKRMVVADGFIHDDYSSGVELDLDLGALGPSWAVGAAVFQPTRDFVNRTSAVSPVAVARLDYLPSLFERAGVFVAGLRDRTGGVGELMRQSVIEERAGALSRALGTSAEPSAARQLARALDAPLESDASIGWAGTSGSLAPFRGQRLGWTLALQGGTLRSLSSTGPGGSVIELQDLPLHGQLASLRWESDLGDRVVAGASLLYASGSGPPMRKQAYEAFLGISPFVTTTNLFFGGGLSETFAARQETAPGVNGRGVIAPALSLSVEPWDKVSLLGKAAYLHADVAGPFGGSVYGTEADLSVTWSPRAWIMIGVELDVLWPGDFYPGRATIHKTVLAVDFLTP
jgi:hypothetical protein